MAESPDHEIQMELNVEQEQGSVIISSFILGKAHIKYAGRAS
jgi:hypothetical protein